MLSKSKRVEEVQKWFYHSQGIYKGFCTKLDNTNIRLHISNTAIYVFKIKNMCKCLHSPSKGKKSCKTLQG